MGSQLDGLVQPLHHTKVFCAWNSLESKHRNQVAACSSCRRHAEACRLLSSGWLQSVPAVCSQVLSDVVWARLIIEEVKNGCCPEIRRHCIILICSLGDCNSVFHLLINGRNRGIWEISFSCAVKRKKTRWKEELHHLRWLHGFGEKFNNFYCHWTPGVWEIRDMTFGMW